MVKFLKKKVILFSLLLSLVLFFLWSDFALALYSSCTRQAATTLSAGINSGTAPDPYYGSTFYAIGPYANNVNCTRGGPYTCPSGNTTKIYIKYNTESGWDKVKIYTGGGSLLEEISGSSGGSRVWKGPYSTNSLKFGFTSDGSVNGDNGYTGFDIWKIECIAPAGLVTSCKGRSTSADTATLSPSTAWQTTASSLSSGTDTKRYKVTVSATGNHEFSLCSNPADGGTSNYDSYLCLFNDAGTSLATDDDGCTTPSTAAKITYNFTSTGTYYIQVSGYSTNYGSYTLAYRRTPVCSGTVSLSLDPSTVSPGGTFTATVSGLSDCDDKTAEFFFRNDSNWDTKGTCTVSGSGCSKNITAPSAIGSYTYGAGVDKNSDGDFDDSGEWDTTTLDVAFVTSCKGRSTSADTATLSPSTSWQTTASSLGSGSDTKRYEVTVSDTGTHEFSLCSDPADGGTSNYDSYLCLFDSEGTSLATDDDGCTTPGTAAKITHDFTSTGTYYIQVSGYGTNYGSYTLAYRRTPVCSALDYPTDEWQRVWYDWDGNCLGDGPNESAEQFDNNWGTGVIADYGKSDQIQFTSSRKIYFGTAASYRFTLIHDDGVKFYIDDSLEIDNSDSTTDKTDVYLSSGYHDFQIDWWEYTGSARISFSYELSPGCSNYCISQGYTHGECYGPLCRSWDQCGDQCVDGVAHDWWDSGGQNGCWWPKKCWCRNIYSDVECNRNYIASGYSYLGGGGCKILFTPFEEGGAGSTKGACGYGEPTAPDKMFAQCALNKCYSDAGYNGEKCTVFRNCNNEWQNSPTNFVEMDGNYYDWDLSAEYVGGKWDASNKQCVKCSGNKKTHKYGDTTTLSYVTCYETILSSGDITDKCESACGAYLACDEKDPEDTFWEGGIQYKCDSNCQKELTDTTPPTTSVSGPSAWQKEDFPITITCRDDDVGDSGLAYCGYQIHSWNGTSWVPTFPETADTWSSIAIPSTGCTSSVCSPTLTMTVGLDKYCRNEGGTNCRVSVMAIDNVGQESSFAYGYFNIDWTPPIIEIK